MRGFELAVWVDPNPRGQARVEGVVLELMFKQRAQRSSPSSPEAIDWTDWTEEIDGLDGLDEGD